MVDASSWKPDELTGFEKLTHSLPEEDDGPLAVTLVRAHPTSPSNAESASSPKTAVLYVHGFVDYFFQTHLAEAFQQAGFAFFAVDLRRYGRSLHPENRPCTCRSLSDYFEDLDWAFEQLAQLGYESVTLVGHSTGCLITSLYAHRGKWKANISALLLNSPFFEFRANFLERLALTGLIHAGHRFPHWKAPLRPQSVYGQSLHRSQSGEWEYDLAKKPLIGFPVTCGWLRAIHHGHLEVQAGLQIACPILVLHSSHSFTPQQTLTENAFRADLVLDVQHMKTFAPGLGQLVTLQTIEHGMHDLVLSREPARSQALVALVQFAQTVRDRTQSSPGAGPA